MSPGEFIGFVGVITGAIGTLTLVSAVARRIAGPGGRGLGRLGSGPGLVIGAHLGGDAAAQALAQLREDVESLRGEVAALRGRLAELDDVQNRLDFAERMLAQARTKGALGA